MYDGEVPAAQCAVGRMYGGIEGAWYPLRSRSRMYSDVAVWICNICTLVCSKSWYAVGFTRTKKPPKAHLDV